MNIPNDYSSPVFTVEVTQLANGKYQASSPGTAVPASIADTESDAILANSKAVYDAVMRGDAFPTSQRSDA